MCHQCREWLPEQSNRGVNITPTPRLIVNYQYVFIHNHAPELKTSCGICHTKDLQTTHLVNQWRRQMEALFSRRTEHSRRHIPLWSVKVLLPRKNCNVTDKGSERLKDLRCPLIIPLNPLSAHVPATAVFIAAIHGSWDIMQGLWTERNFTLWSPPADLNPEDCPPPSLAIGWRLDLQNNGLTLGCSFWHCLVITRESTPPRLFFQKEKKKKSCRQKAFCASDNL